MMMGKYSRTLFLLAVVLIVPLLGVALAGEALWTGVDRIVAVGDVHGDFEQFVKTLRAARVIDQENAWIGGKTHLVQTGDVLDRGPDSRKVMDLLIDLERQALEAGGRVHALIGNHEAMILSGDLRYVHPWEYVAFGGKTSYLAAMGPEGKYGRWIGSHNTVIRINDTLFLHGGISPAFSSMSLCEINETVRKELKNPAKTEERITTNPDGPLWYRGLALNDEAEVEEELKKVLKTHGVERIVVGHTVSKGRIGLRAKDRVVMIDVGMSKCYGGPASCLMIEKGTYWAVSADGKRALWAPPRDADFVDWARERAIRLDALDWRGNEPSTFAFLDEALKGKRIVFLGEMDHFVAERMEYRLLLIRELSRRGFRRIGAEMGLSDAKRMDRFLETGDESWLDRVALYGYRGDKRTDRNDEVAGWTDNSHPDFTRTVLDETRWFLRQLRTINEALPKGEPRLEWFGYDLSFHPGGGYADAGELLAPHKGTPLSRAIEERMARVPGESRIEEAERLEGLVAMLDANRKELVAMTGEADALELRRALQRMADAFRFIDGLGDLEKYDAHVVAAALSQRERRMDHNFDEHLAEWPADEKIILLGHSLHLSKESESIETESFGPMWKSIGTYLNNKLPGEVYGFWLLHDRGRHGVPRGVPPVQSFRSPQDSVERLLAKVDPILMLPLGSSDRREEWLDEKRTVSYGGGPVHTVLSRQTDCLFFIETAHEPGTRRTDPPRAHEDRVPKAERILDAYVEVTGGKAAYACLQNRIEEVTIEAIDSGVTFSMTAFYARPHKAYFLIEGAPIGKIERGIDGDVAWESSSAAGPVIVEGEERADIVRSAAFDRIARWRELFEKADYVGVESVDGTACHKIVLTPEIGEPEMHYYDRASMLIRKAEATEEGEVVDEIFFSDYREVDGVLFPHKYRRIASGEEWIFTFDSIRHNVDIPAHRFDLPDDAGALLDENALELRQLNRESFETVFNLVNDRFWDPTFGGVDWRAVGDELRPKIEDASTLPEARAILRDMISRLGLSHFAIIPAESGRGGSMLLVFYPSHFPHR